MTSVVIATLITITLGVAELADDAAGREYYEFDAQGDYVLIRGCRSYIRVLLAVLLLRLLPDTCSAFS